MPSSASSEVFIFCRAMGVFPVRNIGSERIEQLHLCPLLLLYSLALAATQTFACFFSLFLDLNMFQTSYTNLTMTNTGKVVSSCDVFSMSLSSFVCVLAACKNCPKLIELYTELHHWDSLLKVKSVPSNMKMWLFLNLGCLTVVVALELIARYVMAEISVPQLSVFTLHYTDLAVQLQYLSVVDSIRQRFRLLNQRIAHELTRQRFHGVLNLPPISQTTDFTGTRPIGINSLSDLHWILCGIVHKTNAIFSCQLLFHVLCLFLHIIISPYFFFFTMNVYMQDLMSDRYLPSLLVQLLWVVAHLVKLILLVWPCAATTQEANLTAPIICKLLNREMSPDTKKQLETFVLQLLHHNAEFSPFGLFSLQCHILTSIAGAVTTYLVILIQFENADVAEFTKTTVV